MPRPFTPRVVTANDLIMGDVIYLTPDNRWSRWLNEAEVIRDEDHAHLRLEYAAQQAGEIVGAYLAEVKIGEKGPVPAHFREDFRATGPSNYAHGKQEEVRA